MDESTEWDRIKAELGLDLLHGPEDILDEIRQLKARLIKGARGETLPSIAESDRQTWLDEIAKAIPSEYGSGNMPAMIRRMAADLRNRNANIRELQAQLAKAASAIASEAIAKQARRYVLASEAQGARDWDTFMTENLAAVSVEYDRLRDLVGALDVASAPEGRGGSHASPEAAVPDRPEAVEEP